MTETLKPGDKTNQLFSETDLKITTVTGVNGKEIKIFTPLTPKGMEIIMAMYEAGEMDINLSFGDVRQEKSQES
jgi:hypothetical protein